MILDIHVELQNTVGLESFREKFDKFRNVFSFLSLHSMKRYRFLYFLIGIILGYQLSRQLISNILDTNVHRECQQHVSFKELEGQSFLDSEQCAISDHPIVLLSVLVDSEISTEYLKEIYDPKSEGRVTFYHKKPISRQDHSNVFHQIRNIETLKLSDKYEFYAFTSKDTYVQLEPLIQYFKGLRFPSNETFLSHFSIKTVKYDAKNKLEVLLDQQFVVINRSLLKTILQVTSTKCSDVAINTMLKCITKEVAIRRHESKMNDFVSIMCESENVMQSGSWKKWCYKNRNVDNDLVQHVLKQKSLIYFKESHNIKNKDVVKYFYNMIADERAMVAKQPGFSFEGRSYWRLFSSNSKMYSISEFSPITAMNGHVTTLLRIVTISIQKDQKKGERIRKFKFDGYMRGKTTLGEEFILQNQKTLDVFYVKIPYRDLIIKEVSQTQVTKAIAAGTRNDRKKEVSVFRTKEYLKSTFLIAKEEDLTNRIVLVVPYCCRLETLQRFLANVQEVKDETGKNIHLILVTNENIDDQNKTELETKSFFDTKATFSITLVQKVASFQRGMACQLGASLANNSDLILFIDVDMKFDTETLERIQWFTIQGKQVYYPIVYSQLKYQENWTEFRNIFEISEFTGYWRSYGFGMLSIFKSDFATLSGYSNSIKGWGEEDIDLADKITKSERWHINRSADPSFVHIHHEKSCDENELGKKYDSCVAVRYLHMASRKMLNLYLQKNMNVVVTASPPTSGKEKVKEKTKQSNRKNIVNSSLRREKKKELREKKIARRHNPYKKKKLSIEVLNMKNVRDAVPK